MYYIIILQFGGFCLEVCIKCFGVFSDFREISCKQRFSVWSIVRSGDKGTLFKRVSSFNNLLVVSEEVITWTLIYSTSMISCYISD